jgi:CheY-like chemotaxis protein
MQSVIAQFRSIIVIDDDVASLFLARTVLEQADVCESVLTFNDAQEALEYIIDSCSGNQVSPDLVLLDVNMPVMDGVQFLQALQNAGLGKFIHTSVVVLIPPPCVQDRQVASHYRVRGCIEKPFREAQLAAL